MKYLKNEEEAKDLVQQVFLKTITELEKYQVEYFKSWIYMVAKNQCLMKLRNKPEKQVTELSENLAAEIPDQENESRAQRVDKERKLELLTASLDDLNEAQKQCVTLFYIQKKSYQEIAAKTGFSLLQVKSYIQNGKRNLRLLLEQKLNRDHVR